MQVINMNDNLKLEEINVHQEKTENLWLDRVG
jgi:hypothetical protein